MRVDTELNKFRFDRYASLYSYVCSFMLKPGFLFRRFRDPIRVPRIENRVPRIRENYHRVPIYSTQNIGSLESEQSGPYRSTPVPNIFFEKKVD